jgi:hypothetical protein
MRSIYHIGIICLMSGKLICVLYLLVDEKIDSPAESPKFVDTLFGRSVNTGVLQRG